MAGATVPPVPLWISPFVGLPFAARGRTRMQGLDCWGLVVEVYRDRLAIALPIWDEYDDVRDREELDRVVRGALPRFDRVEIPSAGDVVLFRIGGRLCHVGVIADPPWFLHALEETHGSVVDRLDSARWVRRIEGYYRWSA